MSWIGTFILGVFLALGLVAQQRPDRGERPPEEAEARASVLTGIVDQTGADFVLASEDDARPKAVLRAVGFSEDIFARYVGYRVEVRGSLSSEGGQQTLVVRRVSDIRELGPAGSKPRE